MHPRITEGLCPPGPNATGRYIQPATGLEFIFPDAVTFDTALIAKGIVSCNSCRDLVPDLLPDPSRIDHLCTRAFEGVEYTLIAVSSSPFGVPIPSGTAVTTITFSLLSSNSSNGSNGSNHGRRLFSIPPPVDIPLPVLQSCLETAIFRLPDDPEVYCPLLGTGITVGAKYETARGCSTPLRDFLWIPTWRCNGDCWLFCPLTAQDHHGL